MEQNEITATQVLLNDRPITRLCLKHLEAYIECVIHIKTHPSPFLSLPVLLFHSKATTQTLQITNANEL